MIEGLEPYEEYKDSGLPWLGLCPQHWNLRRTKILFQQRVQKGFPNEPLLAATQTKGVVKKDDYETRTVTAQKDLHLLKLVEPGDYVISLRSFQGGIEVAHCRGIISPAYTVLKPRKNATSRYYTHFFKSKPFIDSLSLFVTGIREGQNIDYERLSRAEMPLPSEDEQTAIVRFLDHANRKIDGFIRAKRKLIGLLNEQKQAIIHRAVTRGLDPDVPLKPSGVPWLGDIPAHWGTITVGASTKLIQTGPFGSQMHSNEYVRGGTPIINPSHMKDGSVVVDPSVAVSDEKLRELARHRMLVGDIVVARRGELGRCALVTKIEEGWLCGTGSLLVRIKQDVFNPGYFKEVFSSSGVCELLRLASVGATMDNLNAGMVGRLRFPLPSIEEQAEILKFIGIERTKNKAAISFTEREIALMQEYRTRLTADIVTGKLDVREAAAKLPDLPADAEAESGTEEIEGVDFADEIDVEEG